MVLAAISYVIMLSLATRHQEHRFLLPALPFLQLPVAWALTHTHSRTYKQLLCIAMAVHLLAAVYLLRWHQAGGEQVMRLLNQRPPSHSHRHRHSHVLLAAPCYSLPAYGHLRSDWAVTLHMPVCVDPWDLQIQQQQQPMQSFDEDPLRFVISALQAVPAHEEVFLLTYDSYHADLSAALAERGFLLLANVSHAQVRYDYDDPRPKARALLYSTSTRPD